MAEPSSSYSFEDDLEEILADLDMDNFDQNDVSPQSASLSVQSSQIHSWITEVLKDIRESFAFYKAAKELEGNLEKVTKVRAFLDEQLRSCIITKSRVSGTNREESQKSFFRLISGGMSQLTALTGNHQLTSWLALQVFNKLVDAEFRGVCGDRPSALASPISNDEADIAHYIGGCVISKLQKRKKGDEKEVLGHLVSEDSPQEGTLLHAKSRGRLTNISTDAKAMFVEMEQVFRDLLAECPEKVSQESYKSVCYKNTVIQDCYFSSVHISENADSKDQVLSDILQLYFKIRIHHKCKIILDSVRARTKQSSKDRALRSKLSK